MYWGGKVLRRMMASTMGQTRPCRARLKVDKVYVKKVCRSRMSPLPRSISALVSFGFPRSASELLRVRGFATWRQKGQLPVDPTKIGGGMVLRCFSPKSTVNHDGAVWRRSWSGFPQILSLVPRSLTRLKVCGLNSCQRRKSTGRVSKAVMLFFGPSVDPTNGL